MLVEESAMSDSSDQTSEETTLRGKYYRPKKFQARGNGSWCGGEA